MRVGAQLHRGAIAPRFGASLNPAHRSDHSHLVFWRCVQKLTIVGITLGSLSWSTPVAAQNIIIDGQFSDWQGVSVAITDAGGDGPFNQQGQYFPGEDFRGVKITDNAQNLFLQLEFAANHTGGIAVYLDTDRNASTGCNGSEAAMFVTGSEPGGHLALADYRTCRIANDFPGQITSQPGHNTSRFIEAAIPLQLLRSFTPTLSGIRISGIAVAPPPSGLSDSFGPVNYTLSSASTFCGDGRDQIIQQYSDFNVRTGTLPTPFRPSCSDFVNHVVLGHFTFLRLSPDSDWAILRDALLNGLETIRAGYGAFVLNSAYRTPQHEYDVVTAKGQPYRRGSFHQLGRAADIQSNASTWDAISGRGKNAGACVEPRLDSGSGHVHVDWRPEGCPNRW